MSKILLSLIFLLVMASSSIAQWSWVKAVGVSGSTDWGAVSLDQSDNFYFSGVSDKMAGTPSKGFVTAKYNSEQSNVTAKWNTKLLGGSTIYGETSNGVDAAGNSYMIDRVTGGQTLKRPDGSTFTYFLNYFFVAKYLPDGTMGWSKKITIPGYSQFQVMPDGTVGILATNIGAPYIFDEQTVPGGGNCYIEIKSDGTLGRSVPAGDEVPSASWSHWIEPGKVFVVNVTGPTYGPWLYQRGIFDLETAKFTAEGTPLSVTGSPNTFGWNVAGIPNAQTTAWDQKTGHLFGLMRAIGADAYLNGTDTIYKQTTTQANETYVVEFDEQMKVVHSMKVTNAEQIAVSDSQIVLTAIVRATNGLGFVTPDTTIKITRTNYNWDGEVVYVMDRNFHYVRHGLIETETQKQLGPNATLIGSGGQVYVSLFASGTLFFQGMPAFSGHSGTIIARLDGNAPSAVRTNATIDQLAVYPNPAKNMITIDHDGAFSYSITDELGRSIMSGAGSDVLQCNISSIAAGNYLLNVESKLGVETRIIHKISE